MSGVNESKSSLKPDNGHTNHQKKFYHVIVAKWEDSPEINKLSDLWERHGMTVIMICVTVLLLIYSIVAIAHSGFEHAKWLFGITMFLWFCMTYMFIRDHCGADIFRVCIEPVVNAVESRWRYLKWYVHERLFLFKWLLYCRPVQYYVYMQNWIQNSDVNKPDGLRVITYNIYRRLHLYKRGHETKKHVVIGFQTWRVLSPNIWSLTAVKANCHAKGKLFICFWSARSA